MFNLCCCSSSGSGSGGGSEPPAHPYYCECFNENPDAQPDPPDVMFLETSNSTDPDRYFDQVYEMNFDPDGVQDDETIPEEHPLRNPNNSFFSLCNCGTAHLKCQTFYWGRQSGTAGNCEKDQITILFCHDCIYPNLVRHVVACIYAYVASEWVLVISGLWQTAWNPESPIGQGIDGELFCDPSIASDIVTKHPNYDMEECQQTLPEESAAMLDLQIYE